MDSAVRDKIEACLQRSDPFGLLPADVLRPVVDSAELEEYLPGSTVFQQGQPSLDGLFVIDRGLVEIVVTGERGGDTVAAIRRQGDFFGETVVLSRQRYPGTARVREALRCVRIGRDTLERLIHGQPDFSSFFSALLTERMRRLYAGMKIDDPFGHPGCAEAPFFRKRVSEAMSSPVLTCPLETEVQEAGRRMIAHKIGALVVVDAHRQPRGLLTARGLVHHLIAYPRCPIAGCRVERVMESRMPAIAPEARLGRALATMLQEHTRHLLVMERERLVGIVSGSDLLRGRSTAPLLLTQSIACQDAIEPLARVSHEVDQILEALAADRAPLAEMLEIMAELHEQVQRRVIELVEERMRAEGRGGPPVPYAWINMGSAARHEQTLRTDQDNAVLFADPESDVTGCAQYFDQFAERVAAGLAQCGFAPCPGGVMASNPAWRRSLNQWRSAVRQWVGSGTPEEIRTLTILLDFRFLHGHAPLAESFRAEIFDAFAAASAAGHHLARDDGQRAIPLSFLGQFVTEKSGPNKGQLNLKTGAIVHLVNGMRLMAIEQRIAEPSTLGRLEELVRREILSAGDADFYRASFETLMSLKIRSGLARHRQGREPDHYLSPDSLGKGDRLLLKDALAGVAHLQKAVQKRFGISWLAFFGG